MDHIPASERPTSDFQQVRKRILAFERLLAAGMATPKVIGNYQKRLSALAEKYLIDETAGSERFMLHELQALINSADGQGDPVEPCLELARSIMGPDDIFVSETGRQWLDSELRREVSASRVPPGRKPNRMVRLWRKWWWLFLVAAFFVYRPVADQVTIWTADPAMVSLAQQADMTRQGELLFLRTQPQLVSDSEMESDCASNTAANNSAGFIEQGCYDPAANRIYLREMPSQLSSMEVVTAAYEMLHVVYANLVQQGDGTVLNQSIEANYFAAERFIPNDAGHEFC